MIKSMVKTVHNAEVPRIKTETIIPIIVQSSHEVINMNLNMSQADPQPCIMSRFQSLSIKIA